MTTVRRSSAAFSLCLALGAPVAGLTPAMATPAFAADVRQVLGAGGVLGAGDRLVSPDGSHVLVMQSDGNAVVYAPGNRPIWASSTGRAGSVLRVQSDGNVVIAAPGNQPVWSTGTARLPGSVLRMQNDGNLAVYAPGGGEAWSWRDLAGYTYRIQYNLGSANVSPDRVLDYIRTNFSEVFPVVGDCPDQLMAGLRCDLTGHGLGGVEFVEVGRRHFSIRSLPGHVEGSGRHIVFIFSESGGNLYMTVVARGPAFWQRGRAGQANSVFADVMWEHLARSVTSRLDYGVIG